MTRDLMFKHDIQELVGAAYRQLERPDGPGQVCYAGQQLDRLPDDVRAWALGVGNPVAHADLQPGEDVVDLGCGAGIDALLAADEVAPSGHVVGVDLLAEMTARARAFAAASGRDRVTFVTAEMEAVPLRDRSVDVVLSNGAVNLSARKSRVLAEAFRVLRPGGRLVVSDLTIDEDQLPVEVLTHPSAWAG